MTCCSKGNSIMRHSLVCAVFALCIGISAFAQEPDRISDTTTAITETIISDDGISAANTDDSKVQEIQFLREGFWYSLAIMAFITFYALAIIRVQVGKMKVIVGWKDLIMLVVIWMLIGVQYLNIVRYEAELLGLIVSIAVFIAIIVMFLISIILTIRGNTGILNILYALIMKLIVIPLIPFAFIVALCQLLSIGNRRGAIKRILRAALAILSIVAFVSFDTD